MFPCFHKTGILLLMAGMTAFAACKQPPQAPTVAAPAAADTLATFTLQKQPVQRSITLPAELMPYERAEIFAKVQGYISRINVDIGDRVTQGQVLALIDAPEISADLNQAQARLLELQAKYRHSEQYYRRLYKASQTPGTVSDNELTLALSQMQADSAAIQSARANVNAYAQMNRYLTVTAPFAGIITGRRADAGSMVGHGAAQPMLVMENNTQLRLRVAVPEAYALSTPQRKSVQFRSPAQPDQAFSAAYSRQTGSIDPVTRTETWEFLYDNRSRTLKAGMYVNVELDLGRKADAFAVPHSAIVSNLESTFIIAVREGKAVHIPVKTGFRMPEQTEIFGELREGEVLLLKPNDEIYDGQVVLVK